MTSERFEKSFDSRSGSVMRRCACGRLHFNCMDGPCFEEGELEELERKAKKDPDQYISHDYSVGFMCVPFAGDVVHDCPCGLAEKAEEILMENAGAIAEYLRRYAKDLRDRAKDVDVGR